MENLKEKLKEIKEIQLWKLMNLAYKYSVNYQDAIKTCENLKIEILGMATIEGET